MFYYARRQRGGRPECSAGTISLFRNATSSTSGSRRRRRAAPIPLVGESPLVAAALDMATSGAISQQTLTFALNQARPSAVLIDRSHARPRPGGGPEAAVERPVARHESGTDADPDFGPQGHPLDDRRPRRANRRVAEALRPTRRDGVRRASAGARPRRRPLRQRRSADDPVGGVGPRLRACPRRGELRPAFPPGWRAARVHRVRHLGLAPLGVQRSHRRVDQRRPGRALFAQ